MSVTLELPDIIEFPPAFVFSEEPLKELNESAFHLLKQASGYFKNDFLNSVSACNSFLRLFEFVPSKHSSDTVIENYRIITSAFLNHNHSSDSIMYLKATHEAMLGFCNLFFRVSVKKGIEQEKALVRKEDAQFFYFYCAGLYNSVFSKIMRTQVAEKQL